MIFLVYVSSAVKLFSPAELDEILAKSRQNNTALGITGMLLYKDGNLMQALEGEAEAVQKLYAKIALDLRHKNLITVMEGPLEKRQFADWKMAYVNIRADDSVAAQGYSDFLNTPLTGQEFIDYPSRCQKLLLTFKRSIR